MAKHANVYGMGNCLFSFAGFSEGDYSPYAANAITVRQKEEHKHDIGGHLGQPCRNVLTFEKS